MFVKLGGFKFFNSCKKVIGFSFRHVAKHDHLTLNEAPSVDMGSPWNIDALNTQTRINETNGFVIVVAVVFVAAAAVVVVVVVGLGDDGDMRRMAGRAQEDQARILGELPRD